MKTLARLAAAFMLLALDWLTGASRHEPVRYGPLVRLVTKHPWMTASAIVAALGIGAASVVVSGVVPVRASSGHWPVTAWLLDFAKLQSVRTYSLGIEPPSLDDRALVVRGAAHYAMGCEPCHGGPDGGVPLGQNDSAYGSVTFRLTPEVASSIEYRWLQTTAGASRRRNDHVNWAFTYSF